MVSMPGVVSRYRFKMVHQRFKCREENCLHSFSRKWNLIRHEQRYHNIHFSESCLLCNKQFFDNKKLQEHLILDHRPSDKFYLKSSAFEETVVKYRLTFDDNELNFNDAQIKILGEIKETIRFEAARKTVIKVNLVFICQMSMQDLTGDKIQTTLIPFRSSTFVTNGLRSTGLTKKIGDAFRQQENFMEEFCDTGSSWMFDRAVAFDVEISGIKPLAMGSGKTKKKKTRNTMKHQKYLYDPQNRDEKCFLRCLHFLVKEKAKYPQWEKKLDLSGISFPITVGHIKKFVKQNDELDITINILFRTLSKLVFPYECGIGNGKKVVNLLLVQKKPKVNTKIKIGRHFLGITDVNKYLSQKYINPRTRKCSYHETFYCLNCFNTFGSYTSLSQHELICLKQKPVLEVVPNEDEKIKFKNYKNQHMQDLVGFLDFECLLKPGENVKCTDCKRVRCKCDKSFSELVNHQDPFAYSFVVMNSKNDIIHEKTYIGEDAATNFVDHLMSCWVNWIKNLLRTSKPMKFTEDNKLAFDRAQHCYLCKKSFKNYSTKQRDHNHFSGQFLGAACLYCNLQRRRPHKLPIFLHNGSKYDFHFIIRALNQKNVGRIKILPYNGEHFRTIEFKGFQFLDSIAFLQASLDQLSDDLSKTNHDYRILKQTYLTQSEGKFDPEKFEALIKKSYYPYEYCTDMQTMIDTKKLPNRSKFYSKLKEKTIDRTEHEMAKKVWKLFDCQNLIDYTKIYCKLDTILLAEIFQKFRNDMQRFSSLDPSHYISLPAFAFDSMLKITNCILGLMTDIDMIHLVESSIRGGVSFISNRFLKSEQDSTSEIVYIDANVSVFIIIILI